MDPGRQRAPCQLGLNGGLALGAGVLAGPASLDRDLASEDTISPLTMRYTSLKFRNHELPMSDSTTRFGFVAFAETWNGRLAMLGFVIGLATELLTGQGILSQIGLG